MVSEIVKWKLSIFFITNVCRCNAEEEEEDDDDCRLLHHFTNNTIQKCYQIKEAFFTR